MMYSKPDRSDQRLNFTKTDDNEAIDKTFWQMKLA